ncbi:hypothetical protein ACQU0X_25880 [Pseudovibrio ascidiaceicola]|uniref:hypothetical protein n=1 Tax=Pseudovibrio ascidiaceicola TaxID=285279 RepID=UPI003D3639FC
MPRLKKETLVIRPPNGLAPQTIEVVWYVNAGGEFYCKIPDKVLSYFEDHKKYSVGNGSVKSKRNNVGDLSLYSDGLIYLQKLLKEALTAVLQPTVIREHVIRYNIESHVMFALTSDDCVVPNSGYPDAEWPGRVADELYGGHNAHSRAQGGYSLTVGAVAMTKITSVVGDNKMVDYDYYYKDGCHLGRTNPAEMLNSWKGFELPRNPKEIPYSDEAALFFFDLMLSMANLSKRIQEATFNQASLLQEIERKAKSLITPNPSLLAQQQSQ